MPAHDHAGYVGTSYGGSHIGVGGFEEGRGNPDWAAGYMGLTGNGNEHTHTLSFDVAYVDVILAQKN